MTSNIKFQLLALCLFGAWSAHAAWPDDQALKIIVPQAAGGTNDTVARIVAVELGKALKQAVVVENRPGAGGAIGMQAVVQAAPDGYTLGMASDSATLLDIARPTLKWKVKRDLQGVGMIADQPVAVAVSARSPYKSFEDLLKDSKLRPGDIAYGTSGVGTSQHVVGEWLSKLAQAKFMHVPYKGGGAATTDVVSGQIPMAVLGLAPMLAQEKAGKVRIVAVTTPKRDPALPHVPTLTELGYPQIAMAQWAGIVASAATPAPVVQRLSAELEKVLALPSVRQQLADAGMRPQAMGHTRFTAFVHDNVDMWTKLVPSLNITLE